MTPHDNELPEGHEALLLLAADVSVVASTPLEPTTLVPGQRTLMISDEATALVGDPSVGIKTHGR